MTRNRFRDACLPLLILLATLAAGCAPIPSADLAREPARQEAPLRVGVTSNAPPFVYRQEKRLTGLEVSLAMQLGDFLGRRVEFVEIPWQRQIDYLTDGKTDIIMSGMTITEQRSHMVDFATPYLRSGQILLVRMEDRQRFSTGVDSLLNTNYRIGTVTDTSSDFFITAVISKANKIPFREPEEAVAALIDGKIDVFLFDAPVVSYYAARHQADKLVPILIMATEEYIGWAVRKNDPTLLGRVNAFVAEQRSKGLLAKEINRWIPYLESR